jgi:hypothetical protein
MQNGGTGHATQRLIDDLAAARRSLHLTTRFGVPISGAEVRVASVDGASRRSCVRREMADGANHLLDAAAGLLTQAEQYPLPGLAERLHDQVRTLLHNAAMLEAGLLRLAASANGSTRREHSDVPIAA